VDKWEFLIVFSRVVIQFINFFVKSHVGAFQTSGSCLIEKDTKKTEKAAYRVYNKFRLSHKLGSYQAKQPDSLPERSFFPLYSDLTCLHGKRQGKHFWIRSLSTGLV
jgi:hypothetical protein